MDLILFIAILISGTVFGSFFTLAVYRIPKHEDITHVRSYCPNCNHKLGNLDLIPVLSYLFLGGKCRYCKIKIRSRYILLEIFSGLVFLFIALTYGINVYSTYIDFINLFLNYLFLCGVFIIGGIDKEKFEIPNGLIIYTFVIGLLKLLFSFFADLGIITNVLGFAVVPLFLLLINKLFGVFINDENKLPFGVGDIKYIAVIGLFLGFGAQLLAIFVSVFIILIYLVFKKDCKVTEIAFGYFLSIGTSVILIIMPYLKFVIESIELIFSF